MSRAKPIEFRGSSLVDLRNFPDDARRDAGYQLAKLQHGKEPDDWKPMPTIGRSVRELRVWEATGTFRVIYVATLPEAVYVLHCFRKSSQRTSKLDIDLAAARLRALLKEHRS